MHKFNARKKHVEYNYYENLSYAHVIKIKEKDMDLKEYLKITGLTQQEFASRIGTTACLMHVYAQKKHRPSVKTSLKIIKETKGLVGVIDLYPELFEAEKQAIASRSEEHQIIFDLQKRLKSLA